MQRPLFWLLNTVIRLFPHCQIYICVVKLETRPMRARTLAMDLERVVTRQCEYIIKIYSVLIFPLVTLLHRSLSVWKDLKTSMALFAISVNIKHFFVRLNSAVFTDFICENRKLPFLCLKHPLIQHFHKDTKWTAMRQSQVMNVAKHALGSKVCSPLFTQAWKLLSGSFLFCWV